MSNACDPTVQQARQDALDAAYLTDGRDNPAHSHHALYTGLMVTDPAPTSPSLEDQLAAWWRQSYPNATLNAQTGQMMCAFGAWLLEQRENAQ